MADDYAPIFSPPDIDYSEKQHANEPKPVLPPLETAPAINPRIFELEKKPKPVLAHDRGAGAPCLNCQNCPSGLDLHFWRKICRTCKCRKEDHDVHDFSEDPGKILIGRLFDRPVSCFPDEHPISCSHTVGNDSVVIGESVSEVKKRLTADWDHIGNSLPAPPEHNYAVQRSAGNAEEDADRDSLHKYEWTPPGITAELVKKYMEMLPEEQRPIEGTEGAVRRRKALEYQFPPHDCDASHMHRKLTAEEETAMAKYVDVLKKEVVGQGEIQPAIPQLPILPFPPSPMEEDFQDLPVLVTDQGQEEGTEVTKLCESCPELLKQGDLALFTKHGGPDACWHPGCFKCCVCDELLVDMLYFFKDNKYYCGRHYGNTVFPRCAGCDELIFAREYTRAEEKDWHLNHFCCFGCDLELGGQKYMVNDSQPYCFNCYLRNFAHMCQKCSSKIGPDVKRITHGELHWHATEGCFRCSECGECLLGKRFILKNKTLFCSSECKVAHQEKRRACNGEALH